MKNGHPPHRLSKSALARALGVSRPCVSVHLAAAGAPAADDAGRFDLNEVALFMEANAPRAGLRLAHDPRMARNCRNALLRHHLTVLAPTFKKLGPELVGRSAAEIDAAIADALVRCDESANREWGT